MAADDRASTGEQAITPSAQSTKRKPVRITASWRTSTPGTLDVLASLCSAQRRLAAEHATREQRTRARLAAITSRLRRCLRARYISGLAEAQQQLPLLVRHACASLEQSLIEEILDVALLVAERVIGSAVAENSDSLRDSICRELEALDLSHQAIAVAINSRHPLQALCDVQQGVMIVADPTLPLESAELRSAQGTMRIDWRDRLHTFATRLREAAASSSRRHGDDHGT